MINLEWYRTFKAIYQQGTLTKAASELMISQPNVSIQLAALESYMGHPLFIRQPRKMIPTELGKQLYTQIVESIDNLERVETEFKKNAINKVGKYKIGTPAELFNSYLSPRIGFIDYHLDIVYGLAHDLISQLKNNSIDIAIITQKDNSNDDLTYDFLFDENMIIVANKNFNDSHMQNYISENNMEALEKYLKDQLWFSYNNNLIMIKRFWKETFNKRPIIKLKSVIPDYNAILNAVSESNVLAITSDLIATKYIKEDKVKVIWKGQKTASNSIYLVYNKAKINPKDLSYIKGFIKSSIGDYINYKNT